MEYSINPQLIKKSKLTIGYLDYDEYAEHHSKIVAGIIEAAKRYDVNLIRFSYSSLNSVQKHNKQAEMVLELIRNYELDGLMFLGWTELAALNNKDFRKMNGSVPILSIGTAFEDIPNVYFPGHLYVKEIILHLIKVHNLKRIAYITPLRPDSRNQTYIETMKEYGIYDPELYIDEKDLSELNRNERAYKALSILFDERKQKPEAIISLYKRETRQLIIGLKARGISVPGDIAVTSYEDDDMGRFSSPAFTSIYFPWMELGYCGCEKMVELLTKGHIPLSTAVYGKVVYRNSCGCSSHFVETAKAGEIKPSDKIMDELTAEEKQKIADDMENKFRYINIDFKRLLAAFIQDYENKTCRYFADELTEQLKNIPQGYKYSDMDDIVSVFRKLTFPYLVNVDGIHPWLGNIFQQAQVLIKEKIAGMRGYAEVQSKNQNQALQEISRELLANFSVQNLMNSLEKNLSKIDIPACHIFLFDSIINSNEARHGLFENCMLAFEYKDNAQVKIERTSPLPVQSILPEILNSREGTFTVFVHLLNINDEYMGFVMFEPGPVDERIYQGLSVQISTALRGALLLEKLDKSYKKLIEQAHKEGMADIAAGILHNIGNAFSSVNSSVQIMRDIVNMSPLNDLKKANILLEDHIDSIESFIRNDAKGRKLMQFYLKLGSSFKEFKNQLFYHINRLDDKINSIDDMITAQQSYAGVESMLEKIDVQNVIEDVLKVNNASLDKSNVQIIRYYKSTPKVLVQRAKLFHILANLVKNSKEAMEESQKNNRRLVITVYEDHGGKYIRISDSGCGIPPSMLEKIFTYGYSTKKNGQGFGLYSCENYMAEIGGRIWAESEGSGRGAVFTLQFP